MKKKLKQAIKWLNTGIRIEIDIPLEYLIIWSILGILYLLLLALIINN